MKRELKTTRTLNTRKPSGMENVVRRQCPQTQLAAVKLFVCFCNVRGFEEEDSFENVLYHYETIPNATLSPPE